MQTEINIHKTKRRRSALSAVILFMLVFYQIFLPIQMAPAWAEETASPSSPSTTSDDSSSQKDNEEPEERSDKEKTEETQESTQAAPDDQESQDTAPASDSDAGVPPTAADTGTAALDNPSASGADTSDSASNQDCDNIADSESETADGDQTTDGTLGACANNSTAESTTNNDVASNAENTGAGNPAAASIENDSQEKQNSSDEEDAETADPQTTTEAAEVLPQECQTVPNSDPTHVVEGNENYTAVLNENCAIINNGMDADVSTGTNDITQGTDPGAPETVDAVIGTGDAQNVSSIVNQANINTYGENGELLMYNIEGYYAGDINLLNAFQQIINQSDPAPETPEITEVVNNNEAIAQNNVNLTADTGNNTIDNGDPLLTTSTDVSSDAHSEIDTGDALGMANLLNFFNTNIVGNNWLLAMVNVFGTWTGDLIVPGEGLLTTAAAPQYTDMMVTNNNNADLQNNITTAANTGENGILGANGEIITGTAVTAQDVDNIANTNIVKNNWFLLMVNNMGSWAGNVMNWNALTNSYDTVYSYDFGSTNPAELSPEERKILVVENNNEALVQNNVNVDANTGKNDIASAGEEAQIETGDAVALAKILNFVNTNVVGSNWLFGVVNVFGSWTGNAVFAYPDLEVSITDNRDEADPGEELTYKINYKNVGEADAENVELQIELPSKVDIAGYSSGLDKSGDSFHWSTSKLNSGDGGSFEIKALVDAKAEPGKRLESAAGIKTSTKEENTQNNVASDNTKISKNGSDDDENDDSGLKIARKSSISDAVRAGENVTNLIMVANSQDKDLVNVKVEDKLYDSSGAVMGSYSWDLGDLDSGDIKIVKYEMQINPGAPSGHYSFAAQAEGKENNGDGVRSSRAKLEFNILSGQISGFSKFIPKANAGDNGQIASAVDESPISPDSFPTWILLAALAAYTVAINWSLDNFRRRYLYILGHTRLYTAPTLATIAALGLWSIWSLGEHFWYPISVLVILITSYSYYYYRESKFGAITFR